MIKSEKELQSTLEKINASTKKINSFNKNDFLYLKCFDIVSIVVLE